MPYLRNADGTFVYGDKVVNGIKIPKLAPHIKKRQKLNVSNAFDNQPTLNPIGKYASARIACKSTPKGNRRLSKRTLSHAPTNSYRERKHYNIFSGK